MSEKFINKIDKLIVILIKATVFLLPLFFLPWASDLEFSKQFLLWLLMPVAALLWLYKTAAARRLKIEINPLNLPILIFLSLTAAAAFFSLDRFSSFFGHFSGFSDAWLGLLSLVIFYFLIINTEIAATPEKIIGLLKLLLYSALAAAAIALAARLGWLSALGGLLNIFPPVSFNPAGDSLFSLAVFLAIMSIIPANFLFTPAPNLAPGVTAAPYSARGIKKFDRVFFSVCLAIFLLVLILIDFSLSWVILLLGAGLLIFSPLAAAGFNFKKILNYYLLIPAGLMLLSALMLMPPGVNLAKALGRELPKEALLGYNQSWIIAKETFRKNPALGSGPGTFAEDFSLYRPAELNSTVFWQIRFDKSRSRFLEILATAGLLSLLSYFLIICLVFYLNIILIKKYLACPPAPAGENYNLITVLFNIFILIFFSQIFFFTNTVLNFIFWLFLGLAIAFWQKNNQILFKEKIFFLPALNLSRRAISAEADYANKPVFSRGLMILSLFILSAGVLTLLVFAVRFFAADLIATRGSDSETELVSAIKLNPYRDNYRLSLAKIYLNQAGAEALKPAGQRDELKLQSAITGAIETAKPALALAPNSVLPRETLGMIYRDIRPLTSGSEPWAVKYFGEALALEPTNPVLATELAKAYFNLTDLAGAEKYFKTALELKSDYYEAKFSLAKTYLKDKQDNQAFTLLNELAREVQSAEVYYELGRYYYNHGEIDKAMDRFELALSLSPRHANSLYSLAVAYEAKGDFKEALKYYNQVLELNWGNVELEKKIKELSK